MKVDDMQEKIEAMFRLYMPTRKVKKEIDYDYIFPVKKDKKVKHSGR